MASVNKVILVGYLGNEPELRRAPSGVAVTNFSLATTEKWTDRDEAKQERTEWHRVIVWRKQAEACAQYLSKGRQCYVEGRIQSRKYEDKDGNERHITEIVASNVMFLGGKEGGGGQNGKPFSYGPSGGFSEGSPQDPDDDVPF